jgi:hypothetical protein
VINNGAVNITSRFYSALYIDGVLMKSWYADELPVNYYAYVKDYAIGKLSAGSHTVKIVADSTGALDEGNEADNEYTKVITVLPSNNSDLVFYKRVQWSDTVIVSKKRGDTRDGWPLTPKNRIYVRWCVRNEGMKPTSKKVVVTLYVDDVLKKTWKSSKALGATTSASSLWEKTDTIGTLTPGEHELKLVVAEEGAATEWSEVLKDIYVQEGDGEVTAPTEIGGQETVSPEVNERYWTDGSVCKKGGQVQYLFHWGDGTDSGWLPAGAKSTMHSWHPGSYQVGVSARCQDYPTVRSEWIWKQVTVVDSSDSGPGGPD